MSVKSRICVHQSTKCGFSKKAFRRQYFFLFPYVLLTCYHHLRAKLGMYIALCIFLNFWQVWAELGSQELYSKLTSIFPWKTHDSFKINIQKMNEIRKSWAPLFSNQKRNVCSSQWLKRFIDENQKTYFMINKKTFLNNLDTFHVKSSNKNWNVYL